MSAVVALGRLEKVPLRTAWPNEAGNFTPWLAEESNLAFLSEALGLRLELEAVEKQVGPFSADILAKDAETQRWVIIENQIAPTDHAHLGQLLTYAAGLDARIVVWIAETFREEHRAAIDFLNNATADEFWFFGVQIELWKIQDSICAPRFSPVSLPNSWSKQAQSARQVVGEELSETQRMYLEFWSSLIAKSRGVYSSLSHRAPYRSSWQLAETLKGGDPTFQSNAAFTGDRRLRCELYLSGRLAKAAFRALRSKSQEIEATFGSPLSWEELPESIASRIALYMPGNQQCVDRERWPEQQAWLLNWWPRLAETLRPYIDQVDVSEALVPATGDLEPQVSG